MRKNSPSTAGHISPQFLKKKKQREGVGGSQAVLYSCLMAFLRCSLRDMLIRPKLFKDPSSHFMFFLKRTGTEKLNFSVIDVTYNNYN